jgi:hypothetical protein
MCLLRGTDWIFKLIKCSLRLWGVKKVMAALSVMLSINVLTFGVKRVNQDMSTSTQLLGVSHGISRDIEL